MKKILPFMLLFAASVLALPAVPAYFSDGKAAAEASMPEVSTTPEPSGGSGLHTAGVYRVLDISTGEVIEVPAEEYIIGAVCAEMPASFEPEALKAQAVAAHTYAERQRLRELENPTPELCGADFSNDTSKYQGYFTLNQAKQYFGENFEVNYNKIKAAASEVSGYILTYEDEPIVSAFHSMSSGRTESAENAWGTPVDYLVSVDSSADTSAPKYLEEVTFPADELRGLLEEKLGITKLGEDVSSWIKITETSDSGTVLTASAGGKTISGNDLREALSLRSACFEITCGDNSVMFTTKGYGHGVGMSQYGANSMAQEGSTWREILEHYYSGCEIVMAE